MPKTVYDTKIIYMIDGTELSIYPLKIKYLKQLMDVFSSAVENKEQNSIDILIQCVRVAMKQFYPSIKTMEDVEDNFDIKTIYSILDTCAGIKFDNVASEEPKKTEQKGGSWEDLDLAKIESEAFLLGIWKDYEDLEISLSLPELSAILEAKREEDYNHKKFLAAIQGVDLDSQVGRKDEGEELKARVFSKGKANSNDVVSLQGQNAAQAGFGIGMGLDYEVL